MKPLRKFRFRIEAFNPTFTDLQGTEKEINYKEMAEFNEP